MNTTHEAEDLHFLREVIQLSGEAERRGNLPIGTAIAMAMTSQPQHAGFPLTLQLESSNLPKCSAR
ncbi:hypothetical protein ACFLS0_00335 [Candidatus Bipolaricaulota bacterium]